MIYVYSTLVIIGLILICKGIRDFFIFENWDWMVFEFLVGGPTFFLSLKELVSLL